MQKQIKEMTMLRSEMNRRTIRATPNLMDQCTVISIYPVLIDEVKHTIQPGRFIIQPGTFKSPSILNVGPSSWWREINDEEPLLEIPTSSIVVADSIVRDYVSGLLEADGSKGPGLFFLPGKLKVDEILEKHKSSLTTAKTKQDSWFDSLVKLADSLWARTNGNPLSISDTMRLAAGELQIKNKPWMESHIAPDLFNCPACGSIANKNYPICQSCKTIINPDLYA